MLILSIDALAENSAKLQEKHWLIRLICIYICRSSMTYLQLDLKI